MAFCPLCGKKIPENGICSCGQKLDENGNIVSNAPDAVQEVVQEAAQAAAPVQQAVQEVPQQAAQVTAPVQAPQAAPQQPVQPVSPVQPPVPRHPQGRMYLEKRLRCSRRYLKILPAQIRTLLTASFPWDRYLYLEDFIL